MYINQLVAFSPVSEGWAQDKKKKKEYQRVGTSFIIGRICSFKFRQAKYELRWLDTLFNNLSEILDLETVQRGRENYEKMQQHESNPRWKSLCCPDPQNIIDANDDISALEELSAFDLDEARPVNFKDAEKIQSLHFDPSRGEGDDYNLPEPARPPAYPLGNVKVEMTT